MDFDYPFANLPSALVEPLPPGGQDELLIVSGLQLPPDRVILAYGRQSTPQVC